jgi:uncharacterized damage-inducible protein DinB
MPQAQALPNPEFLKALLETYAVHEHINLLILEHLDPRAWLAKPAGSKARNIAAIFTHMHNIRRKWLRLSAPHLKLPAALNRSHCTQRQVRAALSESGKRCAQMLAEFLTQPNGGVRKFHRDGWAPPWQPGASMFTYMIVHDVHHRGQICMLAHQLGFPLPTKLAYEIWNWEKLWKQCGFTSPHLIQRRASLPG